MARYRPTVDVWSLDDGERAKLQPGQWIRCGDSPHRSRFYRQHAGGTLAFHGTAPYATRKLLAYIKAGREAEARKSLAKATRNA